MNTIKLTIKGYPVEVSTAADAFELIRLAEEEAAVTRSALPNAGGNGRSKRETTRHAIDAADSQTLRLTLDFMRAIQGQGQVGVSTDRIQTVLGVSSGRAIGGRLALINRILEDQQFSVRDIYSNKKSAEGRIWKPKKSIDAAISVIDQKLKAMQ